MNIGGTSGYKTYQTAATESPKSVKFTDPRDGVEHTAYLAYDPTESFKPSSTFEFIKELSLKYDPENMSEAEMTSLADELQKEGVIGSADASKLKVGFSQEGFEQKTNLLSSYKKMFAESAQSDKASMQTKILASKLDILQLLDTVKETNITATWL